MKKIILLVFVCMSSVFVSQAVGLDDNSVYSSGNKIQFQNTLSGTVKWFDEKKGIGFITPDKGGADIIVTKHDVVQASLISLKAGQKILYTILIEKNKPRAVNLKLPK